MVTKIYLVENCYGDPFKVYIGKTKNCRKGKHKQTYGNKIIYTYIDEIGSLKRKDWEPLETYWIEQFRQWGFEVVNPRKKGGGGREFFTEEEKIKHKQYNLGRKQSKEEKEKRSLILKGRKVSEETKQKISKANKGKKHSKEVTELRRNILKGIKRTEEHKNKYRLCKSYMYKPVLQFDLDGNFIKEWKCKNEAARWVKEKTGKKSNIQSTIGSCCRGKQKTAYGYIWKFK